MPSRSSASAFDRLAPDQRAAVELVLRQGRSYGELADMLGMPEETIRARARNGLTGLAPDLLPPPRVGEIADWLLGQQSESHAARTRALLLSDPAAQQWAATVAEPLRAAPGGEAVPALPTAPDEETPRLNGTTTHDADEAAVQRDTAGGAQRSAAEPFAGAGLGAATADDDAPARDAATAGGDLAAHGDATAGGDLATHGDATAGGDQAAHGDATAGGDAPPGGDLATHGDATAGGDAPPRSPADPGGDGGPAGGSSRLGGALIIGAAVVLVVAVLVFVFTRGDDDDPAQSTGAPVASATATATPAQSANDIVLKGPAGSKAVGLMRLFQANDGTVRFAIAAQGVTPNKTGETYSLWFSKADGGSQLLGDVKDPVGEAGELASAGPGNADVEKFPQWFTEYDSILVTLDGKGAKEPGKVILSGDLPNAG